MREAGASAQSAVATVTPASAAARFGLERDAGAAGHITFQFMAVDAPKPQQPATDDPASKTVALQIRNQTGIPLAFNGSTWNSKSEVTFIKEPNSDLAPGADFTGSEKFTTADAAGQDIDQKFTFNYKGIDPSGAAVHVSLGFSFFGASSCRIATSIPRRPIRTRTAATTRASASCWPRACPTYRRCGLPPRRRRSTSAPASRCPTR